jgi:hypothetical protein
MFRWEGENRLWDKIHAVLDQHIRSASNYATMRDIPDIEGSFHCGELSGTQNIKEQFMELYTETNNPSSPS